MENSHQSSSCVTWDKQEKFTMKARIKLFLNKLTISNVEELAQHLLNLNLIKARAMFSDSIMKSQRKSPVSSNVYASLVAVINSELPDVGLFLVKRLALEFKDLIGETKSKKKKKRNKSTMLKTTKFIAHLVNQGVVNEFLAMDVLLSLLGNPNSDNVEVAVRFCAECGYSLQRCMPDEVSGVFMEFREVLREKLVTKRVQGLVLRLFAIRRSKFEKYPDIIDELDLVDATDQTTHNVSLLHDIELEISSNSVDGDSQVGRQGEEDEEEVSS